MVKVLFGLPIRQAAGMGSGIPERAGLDWPFPGFSTLSRRRSETGPWRERRGESPMNEWLARTHGPRRRQQRKVHAAMDTAADDFRAVEVTCSR